MNLEVKLFATLRKPDFQGGIVQLPPEATVRDVVEKMDIPLADVAVILVNGRHAGPETKLTEGDAISLFPAIAGG